MHPNAFGGYECESQNADRRQAERRQSGKPVGGVGAVEQTHTHTHTLCACCPTERYLISMQTLEVAMCSRSNHKKIHMANTCISRQLTLANKNELEIHFNLHFLFGRTKKSGTENEILFGVLHVNVRGAKGKRALPFPFVWLFIFSRFLPSAWPFVYSGLAHPSRFRFSFFVSVLLWIVAGNLFRVNYLCVLCSVGRVLANSVVYAALRSRRVISR